MRRTLALTLVALACVACSSTVKWQKAGVSPGEQQRDETDCTSRASLESSVPSAQRVSTTGSTPIDPTTTRVAPLDAGVFEECMKTRGYERVAPTPK
jgi:hypothetical protein